MYSQTPLVQTRNGVSVLGGLNLEKVRAFFRQRQSKLSVKMRRPYWAGVCNAGFDSKLKFKDKNK